MAETFDELACMLELEVASASHNGRGGIRLPIAEAERILAIVQAGDPVLPCLAELHRPAEIGDLAVGDVVLPRLDDAQRAMLLEDRGTPGGEVAIGLGRGAGQDRDQETVDVAHALCPHARAKGPPSPPIAACTHSAIDVARQRANPMANGRCATLSGRFGLREGASRHVHRSPAVPVGILDRVGCAGRSLMRKRGAR